MKKAKLLTLLAIIPMVSGCTGFSYPEFGNLEEGEKYHVGILLPVEHAALNTAKDGFIKGLAEEGWEVGKNIEFEVKNAQGKADDQKTMAKSLIASSILTLGLGTGAAKDLKSAQRSRGSKNPILFTAVTDPVDAGLVKNLNKPEGYVTGSSDAQPIDDQIALLKEALPSADKVGIFYTISESNSKVQATQAISALNKAGITEVVKTCTDSTDVQTSLASLVSEPGLDAIYIPTDNNVAANMNYVSKAVKGKNILVFVGEEGMLSGGGHITLSVSYEKLGVQTGKMAAKILSGEAKPSELPVITMTKDECGYFINSKNLEDSGLVLDTEFLASHDFTDVCID